MKIKRLIDRLESCNNFLKCAAFNYDGSKLDSLPEGISDSTRVGHTYLIEVRENNIILQELYEMKRKHKLYL